MGRSGSRDGGKDRERVVVLPPTDKGWQLDGGAQSHSYPAWWLSQFGDIKTASLALVYSGKVG